MHAVAVDTNVLVRLATGDDPAEHAQAQRSFSGRVWLVFPTVVLETEWVLRSVYGYSPAQFCAFIEYLDAGGRVVFQTADQVRSALRHHLQGLDFADALHLAQAGEAGLMTFDRALRRKAAKLGLLARAVE